MLRRKSCWLPVAAIFCLLATIPAQGADGGKTREVPIPGTGLVLRVPLRVAVFPEKPAHPDDATLYVAVETIQSFPRNGVVVRADVIAQRAALAKGQAEVAEGWEETGLSEVVSLPIGGYAVIYPWYSQFEICALEFTMNAAFFVGNRRVTIRYSASPAVITPPISVTRWSSSIMTQTPSGSIPRRTTCFFSIFTRRSRPVAWVRPPTLGTPILRPSWPPCEKIPRTEEG